MELTRVETRENKKTAIAIRPYSDKNSVNMGLEKYGLVLFEGVAHYEQLACIEQNGVVQYITGLNEFSSDIKLLQGEAKDSKIREIRSVVADLEKELASNIIDIEDKDFWNKVKVLKPDNAQFWNTISISCSNDPVYLNPKDPIDRIKLYAIEAGGFSIIAKSYEDARSKIIPPKFYLDKVEETVMFKTEYKKLKNKALTELQKLYDKNTAKLFLVAKAVDLSSVQYKKSTSNDLIYDNMDRHIMGEGTESNKERACKGFLEAVSMDMETLRIKAIVKDSIFYKNMITKADGYIYHAATNTLMGRNLTDTIEYLKNPLNEDILKDLNNKVERYWNS
jgi:hypothetical protein